MAASFLLAKINHITDIGSLNQQYQCDMIYIILMVFALILVVFPLGPNTIDI